MQSLYRKQLSYVYYNVHIKYLKHEWMSFQWATDFVRKKKPFFLIKNGYQTWGGGMKNISFSISNDFLYDRTK